MLSKACLDVTRTKVVRVNPLTFPLTLMVVVTMWGEEGMKPSPEAVLGYQLSKKLAST